MRWNPSSPPTAEVITVGVDKNQSVPITYFPKAETIVENINGTRNVRYFERATAVVDGRWMAVSFYNLATVAWNGTSWNALVDEKQGEVLFGGKTDARIDGIATDGTRAWAVTTSGAVFEWTGSTWEPRTDSGGELFAKTRRFARLAYDRNRERLVYWGGDNGNRASNDTLFFEGGAWRKSKKPGPKLASRKADNYWLYDDTVRGGVVGVSSDGCHLLDGDVWKPLDLAPPCFVAAGPDAQRAQMIVAHDPARERTSWIDPHLGAIYVEGGAKPIAEAGTPPGLVSIAALKAAGAYFSSDFARANDSEWLWTWDPAKRRVLGTRLGSTQFVCELEVP